MEQIEVIAVQMEEVKRMIVDGKTIPHLRMALMLTDNVAEVIMQRIIRVEMMANHLYKSMLDLCAQLPEQTPESVAKREEAERKYVPPGKIKKIEKVFDEKVDFLVAREIIAPPLGSTLKKFHQYRNEVYHRDKIRRQSLETATLAYFDICCDVLPKWRPIMIRLAGPDSIPEGLKRFTEGSGIHAGLDLPKRIAATLRSELHLDYERARRLLIEHLEDRISETEENLKFLADNFIVDLKLTDLVRLIQYEELTPDVTLEQVRRRKCKYSLADLDRWRTEVRALKQIHDKYQLFEAFAEVENDFEPFEGQVMEAAMELDREIQRQIDIMRGK